jgi:dTDP-4-dehydrorhamnose 3,5-epimerase
MIFKELSLSGAYMIKPFIADDLRGRFIKDFSYDDLKSNGIIHDLKEVFYTVSKKNVIRAIHFQLENQQAKLVRCISGHIYDVIVDLRLNSNTFGKWIGFHLYGNEPVTLYIPKYFGHGYLVLEDSIVSYQCNESFLSRGDSGIIYNDIDIDIKWPFHLIGGEDKLIISEKDKTLQTLEEYISQIKKKSKQ